MEIKITEFINIEGKQKFVVEEWDGWKPKPNQTIETYSTKIDAMEAAIEIGATKEANFRISYYKTS